MIKLKSAKQNKGFTLIELLVVISIIGLLSSVILQICNRQGKELQVLGFQPK